MDIECSKAVKQIGTGLCPTCDIVSVIVKHNRGAKSARTDAVGMRGSAAAEVCGVNRKNSGVI